MTSNGHHFIGCQEHPDQGAKQHKQDNPGFTHLQVVSPGRRQQYCLGGISHVRAIGILAADFSEIGIHLHEKATPNRA